MDFVVYILYSSSRDKFYIGQTNNLCRRFAEHNSGLSVSTKSGRPWELFACKNCETRSEAVHLETKLKSFKNKEYLKKFIRESGFKI
ncbi:MAG: GIY-YIG nuclease family protein [Ignavibacteria bacterium]